MSRSSVADLIIYIKTKLSRFFYKTKYIPSFFSKIIHVCSRISVPKNTWRALFFANDPNGGFEKASAALSFPKSADSPHFRQTAPRQYISAQSFAYF